jgi:hypothetical protein
MTGLTMLDWFAGQALAGVANQAGYKPELQAEKAYKVALAMMQERYKWLK